jgi:hypothetical protein
LKGSSGILPYLADTTMTSQAYKHLYLNLD